MIEHYKEIVEQKDIKRIKKHLTILTSEIREVRKEIKTAEELLALDTADKKYLEAELKKIEGGKK